MRDSEPGVQEQVARAVDGEAAVVSAGEAHLSHPTQGLLDALTIRQAKGALDRVSVAIVGDIARSRVARSAHRALATLGVPDIRIVAPRAMMPEAAEFAGARRFESLEDGHRGRGRRHDAAHPARARRRRPGGPAGLPPRVRADGGAPRGRQPATRSSCTRAR